MPPELTSSTRARRAVARTVVGGLAGVLTLGLTTATAPLAQASSTYLCTGYSGCANAGYGHGGYAQNNSRMYWRMYSGHNCTNYVAYRMIKAGMSSERPWSGSGMAYNWGLANRGITDQKPTVGSVAWWNRGVGGMSSSGHVAIVERVVSSTEIIISEDSWGGDFSWRRITKDGRGWPSGFIHFRDKPSTPTPPPPPPAPAKVLANTAPPTVAEAPTVGTMVVADVGTWSGGPRAYTYQWSAAGVPIPNATFRGYIPTPDVVGKPLTLEVTATRPGWTSATARTAATPPVAAAGYAVATPTALSGEPVVGQTLTMTPGTFAPQPETTALQWRADNRIIEGAQGPTLTLDETLVGKNITALTIARGTGYTRTHSMAAAPGPVLAGTIELAAPYTVAGTPRLGETLSLTPGSYTPADSAFYYRWLRDGVEIPGGHLATYRLTAEDLGHEVAAKVTLRKGNFAERVETVPVGLVRTTSALVVRAAGRKRGAVVTVRVTGTGAGPADGEVRVQVGKQKVTVPLQDGRARVAMTRLQPGPKKAVVRYLGSGSVEPGAGSDAVTVKK